MDPDGYELLRGAVPGAFLERYGPEREAARDRLRVRLPGAGRPVLAREADGGALDPYAVVPAALDVLLAPGVVAALAGHLGGAPLLFDAAEAAAGAPDDGPHRDATHTPLAEPDAPLATAVAALAGDVTVTVFPGSQELVLPRFSGRHRHFNAERDGAAALDGHRGALRAALGEAATVTLAPGDVLVLDGDLAHEPVTGAALVAHYCSVGATPGWFASRGERAVRVPHGDGWYASAHADLRDAAGARATAAAPPPQPEPGTPPRRGPSSEVVRDELQHEPGRRGGLVGTVRGIMGRRGQR